MFLKIATLVFLFTIRLRFPAGNLIMQTLRSRYDDRMVKLVHELEKLDYKTRKCKLDLEFLNLCVENNVILKFIHFRVANKELWNSVASKKCRILIFSKKLDSVSFQILQLSTTMQKYKKKLMHGYRGKFLTYRWPENSHFIGPSVCGDPIWCPATTSRLTRGGFYQSLSTNQTLHSRLKMTKMNIQTRSLGWIIEEKNYKAVVYMISGIIIPVWIHLLILPGTDLGPI